MERIGLLGGTFDPPHLGHLWLAEVARQQLQLDRVIFAPVGQPPHKPDAYPTPAPFRLEMVRLAITGNDTFVVSAEDITRPTPHYTLTLLQNLIATQPKAIFWLLLGLDSLVDFPHWHRPDQIIQMCRLAVLARPEVGVDWNSLANEIPGIRKSVDFLSGPILYISASQIRSWINSKRSVRYLVPDPVLAFIAQNKLYQS